MYGIVFQKTGPSLLKNVLNHFLTSNLFAFKNPPPLRMGQDWVKCCWKLSPNMTLTKFVVWVFVIFQITIP